MDSRWPGTEEDRPFYEILNGEIWTFSVAAAASYLIRDAMGPPGPLWVLHKSISCRASNSAWVMWRLSGGGS